MNNCVGVVVIGRNEGDRLIRCIKSALLEATQLVYVDSGSIDSSVETARSLGVEVVELDMSLPFTAARARNEGFKHITSISRVMYVQFVDGDCELMEGWLVTAAEYLDANLEVAVVSGRLTERFPDKSIYNMLCDIEWDTPVGNALSCGGNAMCRVDVFSEVGGFNDALVAGEEPELCIRIRKQGNQIEHIDAKMALHDAAIYQISQWWKRSKRGGHAFAQVSSMHEGFWVKEKRSAQLWGGEYHYQ